ncbi:DUF979 domain-containing protein [Novosphingobium sp. 1949]|uniref:DUF979 domain-containing protein n=1 Tax=Novosphingobium organovorum TaxID=2930092 RepID=A0ABT0BFN5_9SPHN|nr:DUF979 domain-containing protein [Novosphingobium organovorum]MCJ2183663.1 DUF979 domain-containing protein [Novosphingobium organovorum]
MITLEWLYMLAGLVFSGWALLSARDRANPKRWGNAAFWGLLAASFFFGSHLSDLANGLLVLALVGLAGTGQLGRSHPATTNESEREASAARLGNRLFVPALVIPLTAVLGTLLYTYTPLQESGLFEARRETLILFGLGVLVALAIGHFWLRPPALAPLEEGRRLMDSIGWAAILPQMLAALGGVFALAGVGTIVGDLAARVIPEDNLALAVLAFCLGMLVFTIIMGNAFAAFPVMASAIGVPVLAQHFHGNVALIGAVGMLSGFCGTLLTPMAANFNIVPAVLLDLKSEYGVIRAQAGTALPLFACNVLLIYFLAFP